MGVGQSRELLGKVPDDRVFVCTNREELLALLSTMQNALMLRRNTDTAGEEDKEEGEAGSTNGSYPHSKSETPASEDHNRSQDGKQWEEKSIEGNEGEVEGEENAQSAGAVVTTPIEVIHVPNHYLGDEGLITGHPEVLQVLAASTSLRSLNIGFNSLTARSVAALLGSTSENHTNDDESGSNINNGGIPPTLLTLNLAGNSIGREGCELLAEFLARDPPLRELSLFHNGLYDSDVEPLLHALRTNTHLRLLNLDYNFLTGGFLLQLLELLPEYNDTLAVVLFDGPYDMETFERKRSIVWPEEIPDASKVAENARALLRQKLIRTNLSGRIPFPADLVKEVETILSPRRAAYIAELEAERQATTEQAAAREAAALLALWKKSKTCSPMNSSRNSFTDKDGIESEEHQKRMEVSAKEKDETNEDGEDEMSDAPAEGSEGPGNDTTTTTTATHPTHTDSTVCATPGGKTKSLSPHSKLPRTHHTVRFHSPAAASFTMPPIKTTQGHPGAASTSGNAAVSEAAQAWRSKRNVDIGKELSNGFDRLVLAPPIVSSGAKTIWYRVECSPCRLRACWCDPRDAPVPYGGKLHYHCKHEPTDGELGDMSPDGVPLAAKRKRHKQRQDTVVRRLTATSRAGTGSGKGKGTLYEGCKATSHRCESLGFYGRPKPDLSSVYFFASPHPMQARSLLMDNDA